VDKLRRTNIILLTLGAAGGVVVPISVAVWPLAVRDTSVLVTTFASIVLVYLSLIGAAIREMQDRISTGFAGLARVEPIAEDEFYARFSEAIRTAEKRVKITYMSNKSPLDTKDVQMREYYRNISALIKKNGQLEFRRIVRAIPSLGDWIEKMVEELGQAGNFSLACLPDTNPDDDQIDAVPVQCVDTDKTFLVAVAEQQETREPRDLLIVSEQCNRIWNTYYDRLWRKSIVVVDRGRVNSSNLTQIREVIRGS